MRPASTPLHPAEQAFAASLLLTLPFFGVVAFLCASAL